MPRWITMTGSDLTASALSFFTGATIAVWSPLTTASRISIRVGKGRSARPGCASVKNGRLWRRRTLPATGARYVFFASVFTHLATRFVSSVGVSRMVVRAGAVSAVWTAESRPPSAVWK